jgi:DNA invertase Pin-like site-specific DNA recombinase
MNCYGYARVSTGGQKESGVGMEGHVRRIMEIWAAHLKPKGIPEPEIVKDEGQSRKTPFGERQAGRELCLRLKRGDVLILPKLNRGFGRLRDAVNQIEAWDESGVRLVVGDMGGMFYDSTSFGAKFLMAGLALAAEWEHREICDRNMERVKTMQALGRPSHGMAPYGLKIVKIFGRRHFQPDFKERELMAKLVEFKQKGYTLRAIAAHLNKSRVPTRRITRQGQSLPGRPWCKDKVHKMIETEYYYRAQAKKVPPGHFVTPHGVILQIMGHDAVDTGDGRDYTPNPRREITADNAGIPGQTAD